MEVAWVKNLMKTSHFLDLTLKIMLPSRYKPLLCIPDQPMPTSFGIWDAGLLESSDLHFGDSTCYKTNSQELHEYLLRMAVRRVAGWVRLSPRCRIRCRSAWHRTLIRKDLRSYHFTRRCDGTATCDCGGTVPRLEVSTKRHRQSLREVARSGQKFEIHKFCVFAHAC